MQVGTQAAKDTSFAPWRVNLLAGVAADLLRYSDPEKLLDSIFQRFSACSTVDFCVCHLERNGHMELVFSGGLDDQTRAQVDWVELARGSCVRVTESRGYMRRDAMTHDAAAPLQGLRDLGLVAVCGYPLTSGESRLGTLFFGSRQQPAFSREELEVQRIIADQAAVGFDRIQLVAQLARNNQQLTAANAELRRANAELEQVAFSASHDLREPVRHLNIFSELLARKLNESGDDEINAYLGFIGGAARRLERLVNDLVHVMETAPISVPDPEVPIDARAVASGVVACLKPLIESSGARITVGALPALTMAEAHLAELFERLIENAILHRAPGTRPDIHVFSPGGEAGKVVCVRDNGRGIDPVHQENIFGLFKRLDPEERKNSTGIGLTLCRKIVEHYHGHIWVESELGQGAAFCFTLGRDSNAPKTAPSDLSS